MSDSLIYNEIQPKKKMSISFFFLLFSYFLTLQADLLGFEYSIFHFRYNNLIAFILVFYFVCKQPLFSLNRSILIALVLTVISVFISFYLSDFKYRAGGYFLFYLFTMVCYVLIPYFLIMIYPERLILHLYIFSFLIIGLYAVLQFVFLLKGIILPGVVQTLSANIARPSGFAYEPSYYVLYMTPMVFFLNTLYFLNYRGQIFLKGVSFFLVCIINGFYLVSTSTSAIFGYIGFVFLFPFFSLGISNKHLEDKKRKRQLILCLVLLTIVLNLFVLLLPKKSGNIYFKFLDSNFQNHHSFIQRRYNFFNTLAIFCDHPIFGTGEGAMPYYQIKKSFYQDAPNLKNINIHIDQVKTYEPTNLISEILSGLGLLGMLIFIILFFFTYLLYREVRYNNAFPKRVQKVFLSFFLSYVITLIVMQFSQGLMRNYTWAHFGLMVGYYIKYLKKYKHAET